jgi:hypothetical protein
MIIVAMLIYTVSLEFRLPSRVTVHNQCSNTELVSPVYFSNGAVCPKISDQQIDIGTAMNASFEINIVQNDFEGALLYKLQMYFDSQYNIDTLTTEVSRKESTHIHMLVVWKVKDSKLFVHVALIKHIKEFTWNEDELRNLYNKNHSRLKEYSGIISDTWFMNNNMILKTSFRIRGSKGIFEISIFISEEERADYAVRPLCVDLER